MNMCDFGSISLSDANGEQLACCNVQVQHGKAKCDGGVDDGTDSGGENSDRGEDSSSDTFNSEDSLTDDEMSLTDDEMSLTS